MRIKEQETGLTFQEHDDDDDDDEFHIDAVLQFVTAIVLVLS